MPATARLTPAFSPETAAPHLDDTARLLLTLLACRPTPRAEQAYRAICELKAELRETTAEEQAERDIAALGQVWPAAATFGP